MKKLIVSVLIITAQSYLFTSTLMSMSMPKRIGVGVALKSSEIRVPIWLSEEFVVEPVFRLWVHRSSSTNGLEFISYNHEVNFGLGFFRQFTQEEGSQYIGIRLDVIQNLNTEDNSGIAFDDKKLTTALVNFGISPVLGAEYFFHKRFSLGCEIMVNIDFIDISADYHDLKVSSYSIGTNTDVYIRFYFK